MCFAVIESTEHACVRSQVEHADRRCPRKPLVAMHQDPAAVPERSANEVQRTIHDFPWHVGRVIRIDEIENQPIAPISDQILGVVLWCRSTPVSESRSVVWLTAGVDDSPAALETDLLLVVLLVTDKQSWMDFNHGMFPRFATTDGPTRSSALISSTDEPLFFGEVLRSKPLKSLTAMSPRAVQSAGCTRK